MCSSGVTPRVASKTPSPPATPIAAIASAPPGVADAKRMCEFCGASASVASMASSSPSTSSQSSSSSSSSASSSSSQSASSVDSSHAPHCCASHAAHSSALHSPALSPSAGSSRRRHSVIEVGTTSAVSSDVASPLPSDAAPYLSDATQQPSCQHGLPSESKRTCLLTRPAGGSGEKKTTPSSSSSDASVAADVAIEHAERPVIVPPPPPSEWRTR